MEKVTSRASLSYIDRAIARVRSGDIIPSFKKSKVVFKTPSGRPVAELSTIRGRMLRVGEGLVPIVERGVVPKEESQLYMATLQIFGGNHTLKRVMQGVHQTYAFRGNGFQVKGKEEAHDAYSESIFTALLRLDAAAREKAGIPPRPAFSFRKIALLWEKDPRMVCKDFVAEFEGKWKCIDGEFVSKGRAIELVIVPGASTIGLRHRENGCEDLMTLVECEGKGAAPKKGCAAWIRDHVRMIRQGFEKEMAVVQPA